MLCQRFLKVRIALVLLNIFDNDSKICILIPCKEVPCYRQLSVIDYFLIWWRTFVNRSWLNKEKSYTKAINLLLHNFFCLCMCMYMCLCNFLTSQFLYITRNIYYTLATISFTFMLFYDQVIFVIEKLLKYIFLL